jgi:hypothetical protein
MRGMNVGDAGGERNVVSTEPVSVLFVFSFSFSFLFWIWIFWVDSNEHCGYTSMFVCMERLAKSFLLNIPSIPSQTLIRTQPPVF